MDPTEKVFFKGFLGIVNCAGHSGYMDIFPKGYIDRIKTDLEFSTRAMKRVGGQYPLS